MTYIICQIVKFDFNIFYFSIIKKKNGEQMKRVNDIIENRVADLDDFEEKIEKLNKTKEDLLYYEKTPLPPNEALRNAFIEQREILKNSIYPLEKEVKEKQMSIGFIYKEIVEGLKNNLDEHLSPNCSKSFEDRNLIINHIEEYLLKIKEFSLKVEQIKDLGGKPTSSICDNLEKEVITKTIDNDVIFAQPFLYQSKQMEKLSSYTKNSKSTSYKQMFDEQKDFLLKLANNYVDNIEELYDELVNKHGFQFNIDYSDLTKEERVAKFKIYLNNYEESPYRVKAKITRLKIIITSGNLTKYFDSQNSVENVLNWINFIGVTRIMQYESIFSDYFRLTKTKNNLENGSVIYDKTGTYYLYLKHASNEYRRSILEKLMTYIHGEGNYMILVE